MMVLVSRLIAPSLLAAALALPACTGGSDEATGDGSPANAQRVPSVGKSWNTDWTKRSVDLNEFLVGVAGSEDSRDAIPPLDNPAFESVAEASNWLEDREPIVLVELEGDVRAYPLRILTWHEIVNDVIAGTPVGITY